MSAVQDRGQETTSRPDHPLSGLRILVCGKGGCGKSSFVALTARTLDTRGYEVLALDGDSSNPGGLAHLLLGLEQGRIRRHGGPDDESPRRPSRSGAGDGAP